MAQTQKRREDTSALTYHASVPNTGKIHVLIVPSWWPSPEQPGNGVFHTDYARAFAEAGMRVGVVAPDLVSMRFLGGGTRIPWIPRLTHEHVEKVPVVRIRGLNTSLHVPALYMNRFARWMRRGIVDYIDQHGLPDVLHAMCVLPGGWACMEMAAEMGRPVVITDQTGPFSLLMRRKGEAERALAAVARATAVVTVSDVARDQMKAVGIDREILLCGNPISPLFSDGPISTGSGDGPMKHVRCLFAGRLTEAKGVRDLTEAMIRLRGVRELQWRIVGEGPLRDEMQRRLNVAGLSGRSQLCGHLPRERLREEMLKADFLVLPSHGEAFGVVVAEALCIGLPVVTTRGTGCAEYTTHEDGMLVDRGDVDQLTEAVREMCRLVGTFDRAGIAGRARKRFSRAAVAAWYAELFARLCNRPAPGAPAQGGP